MRVVSDHPLKGFKTKYPPTERNTVERGQVVATEYVYDIPAELVSKAVELGGEIDGSERQSQTD